MLHARRRIRSVLYAAVLTLVGAVEEAPGRDDPLKTVSEKLNLAVETNSSNPLAYLARGNAWLQQQQYERALADFTMALQLKPDLSDGLFNRALTYRMREEWDLAMMDLNYLLSLHPNDAGALNNRAIVWALKGDYATALRELDRALVLQPADLQLQRNRETLSSIMQQASPKPQKHNELGLEESYIRYGCIRE